MTLDIDRSYRSFTLDILSKSFVIIIVLDEKTNHIRNPKKHGTFTARHGKQYTLQHCLFTIYMATLSFFICNYSSGICYSYLSSLFSSSSSCLLRSLFNCYFFFLFSSIPQVPTLLPAPPPPLLFSTRS